MDIDRRQFLKVAMLPLVAPSGHGIDELRKNTITRITGFTHIGTRPKMVGKNSRKDVHGRNTSEPVLWIETSLGIEGFGVGETKPELAKGLIGHTLDEFWKPGIGVVSPLGRSDHALYDLIGKALDVPTWKILGGIGPEWVPVYDGSIYFNDLLPEFQEKGVARLLEEVEASLKAGHRAFKIKVGRGAKWMDPEPGFQRDVEVVKAIRKLVGEDVRLMADANNAFDLDTAKRWLDSVDGDLFFVEEMFPEQVEHDLALKEHIRGKGYSTLVADGESADDLDDFNALIDREALDVLQPDIRAFGLTRQCILARKLAIRPRMKLAPHNWGSFLGLYMQLVLARGIPNFLMAEQDPSSSDLFDTSAYEFKDGKVRVPDLPGCGIALRGDVFEAKYRKDAWTVSN